MRLILLMVVGMGLLGGRAVYGQEGVEVEVVEKGVVMEVEEEAVAVESGIEMDWETMGNVAQFLIMGGIGDSSTKASKSEEVAIEIRMREHAGVWLDWVELACGLSAEQKKVIDEMAKSLRETKFTAKQERAQILQYGLAESMPIVFPSKNGMAKRYIGSLHRTLMEGEVLSGEQKVLLKKAIKSREGELHEAYCGRVLNLFDEQLCFLPDQREMIHRSMSESRRKLTSGLYGFGPYAFTPFESAMKLKSMLVKHLSVEQRALLEKIDENQSYAYIYVEDLPAAKDAIEADVAKRNEVLKLIVAIRLRFYQSAAANDERMLQLLKTASKGVHQRIIEQWREQCLLQLTAYESGELDPQHGINIALEAPNLNLEKNELWAYSTKKLDSSGITQRRLQLIKGAEVGYRMSLADDELWLTSEQSAAISKLVAEQLEKDPTLDMQEGMNWLRSFMELAHVVHQIPEKQVRTILKPSQMFVWKRLKAELPVKEGRVYLKLPESEFEIGGIKVEEEREPPLASVLKAIQRNAGMKMSVMGEGQSGETSGLVLESTEQEDVKIVVEPRGSRPHAWEKGGKVTVGARFYAGDAARVVGVAVDVVLQEVEEHENYVVMTLVTTPENVEQIMKVAKASEYCFEVMPFGEEQREAFADDLKIEEVLGKPEVYRVSGVEDWGWGAKGEKLVAPGVGELLGRE